MRLKIASGVSTQTKGEIHKLRIVCMLNTAYTRLDSNSSSLQLPHTTNEAMLVCLYFLCLPPSLLLSELFARPTYY